MIRNEYATGEVQTDEVQPVTIVDLAKERELKQRIDDLEGAIERKNEVIQQLQNRLPEEISPENHNRKRSVWKHVSLIVEQSRYSCNN